MTKQQITLTLQQTQVIQESNSHQLVIGGSKCGKTKTLINKYFHLLTIEKVLPSEVLIILRKENIKEFKNKLSDEICARPLLDFGMSDCLTLCFDDLSEYLLRISTNDKDEYKISTNIHNEFDCYYVVYKCFDQFKFIPKFDMLFLIGNKQEKARKLSDLIKTLIVHGISSDQLLKSSNQLYKVIGKVLAKYERIVFKSNQDVVSTLTREALNRANKNKKVSKKLQQKFRYILVDDYQDTSLSESALLSLFKNSAYISVFGNIDENKYSSQGTTIENIIDFKSDFAPCSVHTLDTNFTSESRIIEFVNKWMDKVKFEDEGYNWKKIRLITQLSPLQHLESDNVYKLESVDPNKSTVEIIKDLITNNKVDNYSDIALVYSTLNREEPAEMYETLLANNIPVDTYNTLFFLRQREIKLLIGGLLKLFTSYLADIESNSDVSEIINYYYQCLSLLDTELAKSENKDLKDWLAKENYNIYNNRSSKVFDDYVYKICEFSLFKQYFQLDKNTSYESYNVGINLSRFIKMCQIYINEYCSKTNTILGARNIISNFFHIFLRYIYEGGVLDDYDDSRLLKYNGINLKSVTNMQKRTYSVVMVFDLQAIPNTRIDVGSEIISNLNNQTPIIPLNIAGFFEYKKKYYNAFLSAKNMLLFISSDLKNDVSQYFKLILKDVKTLPNLSDLSLIEHKLNQSIVTYSLDEDLVPYLFCPSKYKIEQLFNFKIHKDERRNILKLLKSSLGELHRQLHVGTTEGMDILSIITTGIKKLSYDHNYEVREYSNYVHLRVSRYLNNRLKGWFLWEEWGRIKTLDYPVTIYEDGLVQLRGIFDSLNHLPLDKYDILNFSVFEDRYRILQSEDLKLRQIEKDVSNVLPLILRSQLGVYITHMRIFYVDKHDPVELLTPSKDKVLEVIDNIKHFIVAMKNFDFKPNTLRTKSECENCESRRFCEKID
jgi:DNA helicase-2/ATP-dependent DNA helicase PcrA